MASQIFNLGKLRFTYKGAYSGSVEYQLNDVVKYSNNLYVYINTGATTGNAPTNTSYWAVMIAGLADPTIGSPGQFVTTNGITFEFDSVSEVPSQATHSGKILTTNGTVASWTNELPQLDITGDFEASKSTGITLIGNGARSDNEDLGTSVKSITGKALTSNVATITTASAHGFSPFQYVTIALAPADATFDGEYEIIDVPDAVSFTYAKTASNVPVTATSGTASSVPGYTNAVAVFSVDADDDFAQLAFRNRGNGASSSTDIIVYPDNGTDFAGWFSHGVTSSNFNDPEFTLTGANDAYLFYDAPVGTSGSGNLVIATGSNGTENKLVFGAGGLSSDNAQMSITPDVNVHIEIPTPSTSPTTGAFTVVGGVGIQGDMNIQGDVAIEGTITFGGSGTTVETSNLAVTDPAVFVGTNNQADIIDLAFIGEYASTVSTITKTVSNKALTSNVATLTTSTNHTYLAGDVVVVTGVDATFNGTYNIVSVPTPTTFTYAKTAANVTSASATGSTAVSARRKFAGIARDASDGIVKVFKDATTKPTTTVNFSEAGLAYADLRVGGITADSLSVGTITSTEFGYLDGVTSAIQTQLNGKLSTSGGSLSQTVLTTALETVSVSATAATGTIAVDTKTSTVIFYTSNATGNFVFNFRGDGTTSLNTLLSTGQSVTVAFLVTNGGTPYYATSVQVDGTTSGVTTRWQNGIAPSAGNANSVDVYTFTIIKTGASTFTVLGSQVKFA